MALDLVVSDVITACGGMAAELLGIPWIELNPHPLYRPSDGAAADRQWAGARHRDPRPAARRHDARVDGAVCAGR